ncbi:hypothetical protein ACFQVA_36885 [Actinomadura keratinilytica]
MDSDLPAPRPAVREALRRPYGSCCRPGRCAAGSTCWAGCCPVPWCWWSWSWPSRWAWCSR